jgi:hypothetical protein
VAEPGHLGLKRGGGRRSRISGLLKAHSHSLRSNRQNGGNFGGQYWSMAEITTRYIMSKFRLSLELSMLFQIILPSPWNLDEAIATSMNKRVDLV